MLCLLLLLQVFKVVSCTAMDFDLYFDNSSVRALWSALAPEVSPSHGSAQVSLFLSPACAVG